MQGIMLLREIGLGLVIGFYINFINLVIVNCMSIIVTRKYTRAQTQL